MAYLNPKKFFFAPKGEKAVASQSVADGLFSLPVDAPLVPRFAESQPAASESDTHRDAKGPFLRSTDDGADHPAWLAAENLLPTQASLGSDSARSDHGSSFVWNAQPRLLDIPAFENGSLQAESALRKALVFVSVDVSDTAGLPQDPVVTDTDAGYARGSNGGGGGGKGKTKTVTEPVPEPDTTSTTPTRTPTPTPTTSAATYDYLSGQDTPNGFNIGLVFSGTGWTDALKLGFTQAAEYLSDIILGDVADVITSTGIVDDIRIKVSLATIDGTGGFAGWGQFTSARSGSIIPSEGSITMDSADSANWLSKGIWDDFALHEMLHCLGFGTAWSAMGLVQNYNGDLRFTGNHATDMYNALYPLIAGPDQNSHLGVPVETDGGSGTAGVHWDDATFKNEIMTGALNFTNVVSDMTIAALEDMGYDTIYVSDPLLF